jgi:diguanylate cyclase (GGDEF)-like protein/PAS domain S-box-containing protein
MLMAEIGKNAETSIQHCLQLCRRARATQGDEQHRVLNELEEILRSSAQNLTSPFTETSLLQTQILAQLREPVMILDRAGYLTGWSQGAQTLFGYTAKEAIGQHVLFLHSDDADDSTEGVAALFLESDSSLQEVRRRKKSGEVFPVRLSLSLIRDGEEPLGLMAQLFETNEQLFAEDKQRLLARIIEDSDQGILIANTDEQIVSVNPAFTRITGYSAAEAMGQTPDILRSGVHNADFRAKIYAAMHGAGPWHGEIVGKRKNGDLFPQSVAISVARNKEGDITHAFSIFSDISVLRAAEERMQRLVNYDNLTGLPNRTLLNQLVGHALSTARRNHNHGALLVIDLNRFTSVNDTLGHEVGDELLRQVGQRFRQTLRDEDVLARIGGDEFVAALLDLQKREHSSIVAQNLLVALQSPFIIESHALHIGASIGISVYPDDALDTASLLRFADVAMKRVQKSGEAGYLFYSPEMNQGAKERWRLESELRHALSGQELLLYYQPKVSLRSGRIVGSEALIRWLHPVRGMVPPGDFITVAEETDVILELGSWVLEEACRQIRAWIDSGVDMPPVAVNLSARQFDIHLPARVFAVLERYGIPPERLKLEITESLLVRGPEKVIPIMNELVAMGLGLSLDDFGTGYSSLAYLKKFPITTLKIDRSFVIGVPNEQNDCAIARAIVTMGQQLRQEIVAEGVETQAQMAFLRDLGCDQLQGYLFSPPVPASEFERMVREKRRLCLNDKPQKN